jgi:hypothetical protein
VRDNAAGAVARMINAQPNALPLNQVDYLQSCSKTADSKTDQLIAFPSLSTSFDFQSLTSSEGGGVSLDLESLFVGPFLDGNQTSWFFEKQCLGFRVFFSNVKDCHQVPKLPGVGWGGLVKQILPVLISALPLKEDMEESETVYGCLCGLISASHPQVHNTPFALYNFCSNKHIGRSFGTVRR